MAALSEKCHAVVKWEPESGFKSHAVTVCSCGGLRAHLTFLCLFCVLHDELFTYALAQLCFFHGQKYILDFIHSQNLHVYDLDLNCSPLCNCAVLVPQSRITWTFD